MLTPSGMHIPTTFANLCKFQHCFCTTAELAAEWNAAGLRGNVNFVYAGGALSGFNIPAGVQPVAMNAVGTNATNFAIAPELDICGGNCTGQADCSTEEGETSCGCIATSSMMGASLSDVVYSASCQASQSTIAGGGRGGGRRDLEGMPCPCNASYVSHTCCSANDGLVWEAPEAKLGVLLTQ